MKILLFSPTLQMGGAEKIIYNFYFYLKKKNIITKIILLNNKNSYFKYKIDNNDIINLDVERARYSIFKIIKIIFKEKPDYIFSNQRETNFAVAIVNNIFFRKYKIIIREAAPLKENKNKLINFLFLNILNYLYKSLDGIIFNSNFTKNSFIKKLKIKKYKIINNPLLVNTNLRKIIRTKKKYNKNVKFLTCSRFDEQKNIFTLIDYFKMYNIRNCRSELHIVGDGKLKKQMINHINKLNLRKKIFLHKPKINLASHYLNSDLYLSTSLSEGFGNTYLESLYYNLPVISFDNGGIRDILKKNFQGRIISNKNYFSFLSNINLLLKRKFRILYPSITFYNSDLIYRKYFKFIIKDET